MLDQYLSLSYLLAFGEVSACLAVIVTVKAIKLLIEAETYMVQMIRLHFLPFSPPCL